MWEKGESHRPSLQGIDLGALESGQVETLLAEADSTPLSWVAGYSVARMSDDASFHPDDPNFADKEADMANALADARRRVADVPAETIVANHAMGLYELAAIHLSAQPPRLVDAALGIDALACLVEGLGDRLGESSNILTEALQQIRLAFVQVKGTLT
jgi:hypothetical protein